ncbi:MAG TPA: ion transporter [Pseudomonadales bacterium]|nr:ion transporter [Pseudomonadales bacterium]
MSTSRSEAIDTHLQAIENSKSFQAAVIFIIILSALTVGAKTYALPPLLDAFLPVLDLTITLFFVVEILFRFVACPRKSRFLLNGWNLFDTVIVIGSLMPVQEADAVLIGRLLRVFRVLRLVSVVPQLRFLINALLKAIPRMGYIALLMFIIFYIYGAIGSIAFSHINEELWGDISISMLTLFRVATFEDWTDVMYETMAVHPLSWLYYLSFIFLTAFVFLNMMVGTILGVMTEEHDADIQEKAHDERGEMNAKLDRIELQLEALSARLDREAAGKS